MPDPVAVRPRIVVATTWRRPLLALTLLNAVAASGVQDVQFVFAVRGEPAQGDARAAEAVLTAAAPRAAQIDVTVEAFSEVLSKPYAVALVPPPSPDGALQALAEAVALVATGPGWSVQPGNGLNTMLQTFDEPTAGTPAPDAAHASPPERESTPASPARWWAYLGDRTTLVKMSWGGRIACPTQHVRLLGNLIETGEFEPALARYLARTLEPGQVVVDVGANIGIHTVLCGMLVGHSGHVIAYEPFPDNETCLRQSIAASTLIDVVDVRPRAASDTAATVPMAVSQVWRGQGTLVRDAVEVVPGLVDAESYTIDVPTVRLDDDLAGMPRIDLMKIDVEGAENRVFAGMETLIEQGVIRRIAFECYRTHLGAEWGPFTDRLTRMAAAGWTFRILDEHGTDYAVPVITIIEHGHFETVVAAAPMS